MQKSIQTRVVGKITDKVHPLPNFQVTEFVISYYSCPCTFCTTIPTYFFNLYSIFYMMHGFGLLSLTRDLTSSHFYYIPPNVEQYIENNV